MEEDFVKKFAERVYGSVHADDYDFAKLIVEECIAGIKLQARFDEITEEWVYDELIYGLEDRFGVKE